MHPVLAPETIWIKEMERRQVLADAGRRRLITAAGTDSGRRRWSAAARRRLRDGLADAVAAAARFRGVPRTPLADESAALPSA